MPTRRPAVPAAFALLFLLACGKSPDAPPSSGPALRIVAGAGISDTIMATPGQALTVQVLGQTGAPESGVTVLFNSCPDRGSATCLRVSPVGSLVGDTLSATTDAEGHAAVHVRMRTQAGPAMVRITVAAYGLADSARFTVLPGAAVAVRAVLRDTAVEPGGSFAARAGVVDQWNNLRSDPVTFEATSPAVRVSSAGSVSALAVGRGYVRVRGTVRGTPGIDSMGVTVVPNGRIAVADQDRPLTLENLRAGAIRLLGPGVAFQPAWSPTGDRIAYFTGSGLAIADTLGQSTALATPGVTGASWPEYSRDGLWVYFCGDGGHGPQLFRVHPDGTGLEALQSPAGGDSASQASPSPDGTRVAYTYYRLMVKTLATGHVDTLATGTGNVYSPRWSPDGNSIAYVDAYSGGVGFVRPDGSGYHNIGGYTDGGLSWSPDSKWLVAGAAGRLVLVDVAAGAVYPLSATGRNVAWHP